MFDKAKALKISGMILAIAIGVFLIKGFIDNWKSIEPYLVDFGVGWFIFSVLAYGFTVILTGYNWVCIAWVMDPCITKTEYMNIHLTSAMARYMPGGMWNIIGKAYLCNQNGVSKSATSAGIILEYVFLIISSGIYLVFFCQYPYTRLEE